MLLQRTRKDTVRDESKRQSGKPARLPTLELARNETTIQELSLDGPRLLIGRADDNDMSIPSRYVSRRHILLVRHDDCTILIDLNSTNGTFVNSEPVKAHVLANGDVITVDRHTVFVQYSIKYCDPCATTYRALGDIEAANVVIHDALADLDYSLEKIETDLFPTLSENVPTEVGFIDDR